MNIKRLFHIAFIILIGTMWLIEPHVADAQSYFIADSFRSGRVAFDKGCSSPQSVNVGAPVLFAFVAIGADTWTGSWNGYQVNTDSVIISGNTFSFSYSISNAALSKVCTGDVNWFAIVDVNPTSQKIAQSFRSGSSVLQGGCGGTQTINAGAPVLAAFVTPATDTWTSKWQIIQIPTWGSVTWSGSSFSFPYARVNPSQDCNAAATANWFAIVNANDVSSQVASSFVSGRNALNSGCNGTQTISAGRTVKFAFPTLGTDGWTSKWQIIQIPTWGSVTWSGSSFSFPYARVNPHKIDPNPACSAAADVNWFVIDDKTIVIPLPPPSNLSASCPSPGDAANLSWSASPNATRYELRVDNRANGWSGDCASPNPGDICRNDIAQTSFSFPAAAGANYQWWLHAAGAGGGSEAAHGSDFICGLGTGSVRFEATKDGQPWDSPAFAVNYDGPSGTGGDARIDPPQTLSNMPAGAYALNTVDAPTGVRLQSIAPRQTQTLSAGGAVVFTFHFVSIVQPPSLSAISGPAADASCPVGQSFENQQSLGGGALSDPVVENFGGDDRLVVVIRGKDQGMYAKEWKNGILREWYFIDGHTLGRPKLVLEGNALWIYVQGMDGIIYKNQYQGPGSWSGWIGTGVPNAQFGSAGPGAVETSWGIWRASGLQPIRVETCAGQTGSMRLEATKDGSPWDSSAFAARFEATDGSGGTRLIDPPALFADMPVAQYRFAIAGAAPERVLFQAVDPPSFQPLNAGETIVFTFRFVSPPQQPQSLRIDPPSASVVEQATRQLRALFDPDGPGVQSEQDVTGASFWSSDDSGVARVDAQGLATGVSASLRPVAVRAAYRNIAASALITVTARPIASSQPRPPEAPNLSVDADSLNVCGAIRLTWTNVAEETRYEIERNRGSGFVNIETAAADRTAFIDATIAQNLNYSYRVRACNGAGCSAYSNAVSAINQSPFANFAWAPQQPRVNQVTLFTDVSTAYGGASLVERRWTFTDGNPASVALSSSTTTVRFLDIVPLQKPVVLRVTDSASRQCSATKNVSVVSGETPPNWIEIPPE